MPFDKQDIEKLIQADTYQQVTLTDEQVKHFNNAYRNSYGELYSGDEFHEFVVEFLQDQSLDSALL